MANQQNSGSSKFVLFKLKEFRYAIDLNAVERVIRAVEITPLPKAPKKIMGVINYGGEIIPVINIRKLFHLPVHEIKISDQFIIARTSMRLIVLVVDSVTGVTEISGDQLNNTEKSIPFADYISGVTVLENDIILINDLEKFLSFNEQKILDRAIKDTVQ